MALAIIVAFGGQRLGAQSVELPETASPSFATIVKVNREAGELAYHSMMLEKVKQYGTFERAGKKVTGWYWDHVYAERQVRFSLKDGQAYHAGGKRLQGEEFWRRVTVGAVVLVAPDGQKVSPNYLRVVRPDTLVLVPPPPQRSEALAPPPELDAPAGEKPTRPSR
jgi:hypothetical protein